MAVPVWHLTNAVVRRDTVVHFVRKYYAVRLASMAADVFVQMSVIVRVGSLRLTVDPPVVLHVVMVECVSDRTIVVARKVSLETSAYKLCVDSHA